MAIPVVVRPDARGPLAVLGRAETATIRVVTGPPDPMKAIREAREAMERMRDPMKAAREAREAMERVRDPMKPFREAQEAIERMRDPMKSIREAQEAMERMRDPLRSIREAQEAIQALLRLPLTQSLGNVAFLSQQEALSASGQDPVFSIDALAGAALEAAQRFGDAVETEVDTQLEGVETSLELAVQAWAQWIGLIAAWWQLLTLRQRIQLCSQAAGTIAATGGPVIANRAGAPTETVVIGVVLVICGWAALLVDSKFERQWDDPESETLNPPDGRS